jgi:hypothetical protein
VTLQYQNTLLVIADSPAELTAGASRPHLELRLARLPARRPAFTLFAWLINHQPIVLFSQNKPANTNQPAVLFSQNKSASATNHQPNE